MAVNVINASPDIIAGIEHISESVYMGLCREVGTSYQVAMRRNMVDIKEEVWDHARASDVSCVMISGSEREGFRLEGSDIDYMIWQTNHKVIWDLSQSHNYDISKFKLIVCDSSESPPGFTLLYLPALNADRNVLSACVKINDKHYISSSAYKNIMCPVSKPDSIPHGPCASGNLGTVEYDYAHCFASDHWPPSALSWKARCASWPKSHDVHAILKRGCHFVATGHKLGRNEDKEWRISFSVAEQYLVYSMNHCQFLLYGLLKFFLKEVINAPHVDKLLCSYHMKTAVFWMLQKNTMSYWSPKNLLKSFWICFKLILKWVYEGICPNFFIPENNMFLTNIYGLAQRKLFLRLYALYENGLLCLLESTTIKKYVEHVSYYPVLFVFIDENNLISECDFDIELFAEMCKRDTKHPPDIFHCLRVLLAIDHLISSPITDYKVVMLQKLTTTILQYTAFIIHNMSSNTNTNKLRYIADKMSCRMLKLAAKFGCISDSLYIAMYYFKTLRYQEALSIIESTKIKLEQPHVLYFDKGDKKRYLEAVGGRSWSTKLKKAIVIDMVLYNHISYIDELRTEQYYSLQQNCFELQIPPLVLLHMLEFLCCRHVDLIRTETVLHDLQTIVLRDQGVYEMDPARDISWQILGICQEISGDLQAALYSYQRSLREYSYHKIQPATQLRIQDLLKM